MAWSFYPGQESISQTNTLLFINSKAMSFGHRCALGSSFYPQMTNLNLVWDVYLTVGPMFTIKKSDECYLVVDIYWPGCFILRLKQGPRNIFSQIYLQGYGHPSGLHRICTQTLHSWKTLEMAPNKKRCVPWTYFRRPHGISQFCNIFHNSSTQHIT